MKLQQVAGRGGLFRLKGAVGAEEEVVVGVMGWRPTIGGAPIVRTHLIVGDSGSIVETVLLLPQPVIEEGVSLANAVMVGRGKFQIAGMRDVAGMNPRPHDEFAVGFRQPGAGCAQSLEVGKDDCRCRCRTSFRS